MPSKLALLFGEMKLYNLPQNSTTALLTYRKPMRKELALHPYPEFLLSVDLEAFRDYHKGKTTTLLDNVKLFEIPPPMEPALLPCAKQTRSFSFGRDRIRGLVERPSSADLE